MSKTDHPDVTKVLDQIRSWPDPLQLDLARRILEATEPSRPAVSAPPKRMRTEQFIGLLRTGAPPPSNEECRRIIEGEK
jgi:hypothetical protein